MSLRSASIEGRILIIESAAEGVPHSMFGVGRSMFKVQTPVCI
jgi:hypothetical protein